MEGSILKANTSMDLLLARSVIAFRNDKVHSTKSACHKYVNKNASFSITLQRSVGNIRKGMIQK